MSRVIKRPNFGPPSVPLEDTYSVAQVAEHFGCTEWQVFQLISQGRRKPYRGGLANTFKVSHRSRRIPASSIERHKRYLESGAAGEVGKQAEAAG